MRMCDLVVPKPHTHDSTRSKTHLLTLYFLDSGSYSKGFFDWLGFFNPTEYDYIHQDQIDWFLEESGTFVLCRLSNRSLTGPPVNSVNRSYIQAVQARYWQRSG